MSNPITRWWRKLFIEPAVQPDPKVDALLKRYDAQSIDDLYKTMMAQAPDCVRTKVEERDTSPTVQMLSQCPDKFEVPIRDGKPATIYVYTDDINHTYEFENKEEIEEIIKNIKANYHDRMRRAIRGLREASKNF